MVKRRKDPVREDRIENEAIVDASPEEQAMGWYFYLENKICFPFPAKCIATKVVSPLRKGESAEVIRLAPEDNCAHDMFVLVRWQGRKMAVPLSQLIAIDPDESTAEAIVTVRRSYPERSLLLFKIPTGKGYLISATPATSAA